MRCGRFCRQRRPIRLGFQHAARISLHRFALKCRLPGQHLVQHAPERPDIRAPVRPLAPSPAPATCTPRFPESLPAFVAAMLNVGEFDRVAPSAASRNAFASPKSSTFTLPSGVILMLAGFRSRWMIPCSCAASSASAICFAIGSASSSGIGPRAMRCARSRLRRVPSRGPCAVSVLQPVNGGDVRMIQGREDFSFTLKASQPVGVGRERRWENLDGDLTLQLRVPSPDRPRPSRPLPERRRSRTGRGGCLV